VTGSDGSAGRVRLRACGPRAVLAEVGDAVAAASLAAWVRARGLVADDVVPAARTVLFDGVDAADVGAAVAGWTPSAVAPTGPEVELAVTYDGPDLARVAGHWRCSVEEVVARHTGLALTSAFCGFAPGFAYLAGLPEELHVPRLDTPRTRVPAGSVALAGGWCGVYPTASPGGWLLIGRTDAVLWDPTADVPALLAPGTRVRFRAVR
jgi:KipI family sensor histidine kinase inhibitor